MTYPLPGVFVDGQITVPVSANNLNDYTTAITGLDTRAPIRGSFANPNGNVTGSPGNVYCNTTGGAGTTFWIKESGTGTTSGWVAVSSGGGSGGVPTSRLITTSTGLTGGGDLTADRTLSVAADTTTQRVEVAKNGTQVGANARKRINLIEGANVTITAADNSGSNQLDVTIAAATSGSSGIPASTVTAKADLIVATSNATVSRLGVGTDTQVLTADSTQTTGLKWATPAAGGSSPDATTSVKGIVQLAGDLAGTAAAPTVPGKINSNIINAKGALITNNGTANGQLTVSGTNGNILTEDSTTGTGLRWASAIPESKVTNLTSDLAAKLPASLVASPGELITFDNTLPGVTTLPPGSNGQVLTADSTVGTGVSWQPGSSQNFLPADHGLKAWTYDPVEATTITATTNGTVYLLKLKIPVTATITKIYWYVGTGATTPTSAKNEIGIYSPAGSRLISLNVDTATSTAGLVTTTVASTILNPPFVWAAMVFNAATPPAVIRGGSALVTLINVGLTATGYRFAIGPTAQNTLPASITPASNTQGSSFWAAVS